MRIADYIRPTRQVGQISGPTVTDAVRQPVDTYVRPYAYRDRSLQTITEALDRWSPTFTSLAVEARDRQFKKDVAEGMALMQEFTSKGIDPLDVRMPDIRTMVANGEASRLAKLNKAHEYGINLVQMETAAKGLQGAADDWFQNATFEKNGVQYHVYEIDDPVEFEKAFREFAAKRWMDITGGQYDVRLFQEKYAPTMNEVRQNLEKQYLARKGKVKVLRATQYHTALLDEGVIKQLENDQFKGDPDFVQKLAAEFNYVREMMSKNTSPMDANEMLKDYIIREMTGKTEDQIDAIREAAELVPQFWTDADKSLKVEQTAQYQKYYYKTNNDKEMRRTKQALLDAENANFEENANQALAYLGDPDDPSYYQRLIELKARHHDNPQMLRQLNAIDSAISNERKARAKDPEFKEFQQRAKITGGTPEENDRYYSEGKISEQQVLANQKLRTTKEHNEINKILKNHPSMNKLLVDIGWIAIDNTTMSKYIKNQFADNVKTYLDACEDYIVLGLSSGVYTQDMLNNAHEKNKIIDKLTNEFITSNPPESTVARLNTQNKGAPTSQAAFNLLENTEFRNSELFHPWATFIAKYHLTDPATKAAMREKKFDEAMAFENGRANLFSGTLSASNLEKYNNELAKHRYKFSDGRTITSAEQIYNIVKMALPYVSEQLIPKTQEVDNGRNAEQPVKQSGGSTGSSSEGRSTKTEPKPKSESRPNTAATATANGNTDTDTTESVPDTNIYDQLD